MRSLSKDNKRTIIHNSVYTGVYEDVEFEYVDENDSFLYGIKNLFFNGDDMPIDFQQGQQLPIDISQIYFFQIDKEYRLLDIVPSSIDIKFHLNVQSEGLVIYMNSIIDDDEFISLYDDGQGNILYNSTVVGNCFYNSGVIVLHNNIRIDGDYLFDDIIENLRMDLRFKYNVQFFEDIIELDIKKEDYNYSFNPTYEEGKPLFFTNVDLLNDKNQVVATAVLSRPQEIFGKIKMVIDDLRKI